ncbi:unnamed protein product [Blepharisma stoltei]|uniref:N-acylethanolamine-hydrolyzing acid amidase n=1 Tax=Blepharisma stoltei TaxID=1481888 RepID=A0AAU9IUI5_9CILI|nr:unnamed protein product [Blepharisma stoltei]
MKLLFFALFVLSTIGNSVPERYTVSLNDPPSTRWAHVQAPYASIIKTFAQNYAKYSITPIKLDLLMILLNRGYINPEFKQELQGMAQTVNITYKEAAFLNFMYEYNAFCTSIVVRLTNGTIIHGRNLDYDSEEFLRNTTVVIDVTKDGKLLYTSVGFAWYLGVGTGISYSGFSITQNQRDSGSKLDNNYALFLGYQGDLWAIRQALINENSYEDAFTYLYNAKLADATYYILGGVNENDGSVIVRDRAQTVDAPKLNSTTWYLVQTNYDPWLVDPSWDDRKTVAIQQIEQIGQANMNIDKLFDVLSVSPVLNPSTVFTTIFVPSTGYHNTTIRA